MRTPSLFASAPLVKLFQLVLSLGLGTLVAGAPAATAASRTPAAQIANTQKGSPTLKGAAWVKAQPESRYTLQLLATLNRPDLERFVRQHDLDGPLAYFQTRAKGVKFHVLIQGSYATREEANSAAARMSGGLKPWVRRFGVLEPIPNAPVAAATAVPVPTATAPPRLKGPAWLWSRDPSHYTLQLSTTRNAPAVAAGLSPDQLAVMITRREGQPSYSLFYGEFSDRAAAAAAIEGLPERLRKAGPRPRSFADIHDELSAHSNQGGALQ